MDIQATIQQLLEKLTGDKALLEKFKSEPVKTAQSLLGDKLPEGMLEQVVAGVKAKLSLDQISGAADALKGLFQK